MKIEAITEHSNIKHPFQEDPKWMRPRWFGDYTMSCEVEVGDLLHCLIRAVKPKTVLETGTYKAFSTYNMATALYLNGTGKITTVDLQDSSYIPYVLNKNGIEKHRLSEEPLCEKVTDDVFIYFEKAVSAGLKFNIIYCDDLHESKHLEKELGYFEKLITKPGYLLFHDAHFVAQGSISATVKAWADKNGYAYTRFWTARGLDMVYVHE